MELHRRAPHGRHADDNLDYFFADPKTDHPTLLSVAMSTAGAPASQVFDSEMGLPPQNQLQPGRSLTYDVAFSTTTDAGEAQVDVVPSFDHEHAVFTGSL